MSNEVSSVDVRPFGSELLEELPVVELPEGSEIPAIYAGNTGCYSYSGGIDDATWESYDDEIN